MAVFAFVSGGAAPGVTTSVSVLASAWPAPVVLADCDPAGGQVLAGWLAPWFLNGRLRPGRGLVSFVVASRHSGRGTAGALADYLQSVPDTPHVAVLAGLRDATQARSVDEDGWRRLAQGFADTALAADGSRADVLIDTGRIGPATPWPLLMAADHVLVVLRPTLRGVLAARSALDAVEGRVDPDRLGLFLCAARNGDARQVHRALAVPVRAELVHDLRAAAVFSDGAEVSRHISRSLLARSARTTAERLRRLPERAGAGRLSGAVEVSR